MRNEQYTIHTYTHNTNTNTYSCMLFFSKGNVKEIHTKVVSTWVKKLLRRWI